MNFSVLQGGFLVELKCHHFTFDVKFLVSIFADFCPLMRAISRQSMGCQVYAEILAARNLPNVANAIIIPIVEVEIWPLGVSKRFEAYRAGKRLNGLTPIWKNASASWFVENAELAFIRFVLYHKDIILDLDPTLVAQATIPLSSVRSGKRCVQLRNEFSVEVPLAKLLVYINLDWRRCPTSVDISSPVSVSNSRTCLLNYGEENSSDSEKSSVSNVSIRTDNASSKTHSRKILPWRK